MKVYKPSLLLCVALCFATSCKKEVDMTLVQKTVLENTDIRQIEVNDAWEVTIVADSRTFVELEYSAYLEEGVRAIMEGTQLEIGFTSNVYPVVNSVFRATVHTMQLEKLEAGDASKVQCNGDFTGHALEVELSDASNCNGLVFSGESCHINMEDASLLTSFHFVGSRCNAELESASQFNGQIEASDRFEVELEEASRFVNKGGETVMAQIKVHDASLLNMVETKVDEMHIDIKNTSEATIQVTELMEGLIQDASTVYYKGHPQLQVNCSEDSQLRPI